MLESQVVLNCYLGFFYVTLITLRLLRWGVESKYRELKNRLEIEAFNSIKPICIQQEFFAAMFISNLAAILKRNADSCISVSNTNKYLYKTNRSYILNRIKSYMVPLLIHLYQSAKE